MEDSEQPKSRREAVIADTPPRTTPLVGREPELRAVLGRVDQAPATGLVVVQVSGEPGIGKTSLLTEIARRLRERQCGVLTSASDVLGKRIPYGAVAALIRSLPPDRIRADALAALEISGNEDAGAWFGRACDRVVRLLTELTATRPAALLIDDLDHVDDDSLALLTLVLRRVSSAPLVLVTASRSADAVLLDRVEPYAEVVRLDLAPLSGADVARIVEAVLQTSVDEGLAREVQQRSDGNPFFVTEIARSLRELDLVTVDGNRARLAVSPDAIRLTRREALLRRVAPLENDTRLVARAVSVFRRVRLDQISLLARVASLPEETVVAAFDELLRVHIVVHDDNGYRFSHALVGEALYHEVGPAQRRHLHSLISARLLDDREQGLPVDLLQLAWHLAESAAPGDRVAVGVLAEAAAQARASAPETAAALCFRALQLLPRNAPERAELLALQCRVLARASRPALAIDPGLAALESLQPGQERTRVATAVISSLFSVGRTAEAMALADVEVARGDAPASLEAQRAVLLVYNNRHDDAVSEVARIEALPISSPAEGVIVFEHLAMLTSLLFQHDRTVEYANRALAYSDGQPMLELQALSVCASITALAGLVHDASWRVRRAEDLLDQVGSHGFRAERAASRVALDWLGGRWDAALDGIGRWLPDVEAAQADQALGVLQAIELSIRTWRGELDVAARLAALPAPQSVNISRLHAVSLAEYLIARGEADQAYALLDDNVGSGLDAAYSCVLVARMIELDLERGHPEAAEKALARLSDVSATRVSPWSRTTVRRVTGIVRRDVESLREAVSEAALGGLEFEKARAQLALGEISDDEVPVLVEAYTAFQRLGAHGLRRQAGTRLRALGAKVPRARSKAPGLLTEAEENVARLVQQGMRNRDIAAALHYSPRTIEVYLSRIYAKLHVSSRLELARVLDAMQQR
ncbi:regulatory protein, luxR family [Lentzea waywayandensis]|uniref:Regulatory protein, luxR family n=1 Tax=Lentzea waywayandensis TaxID=84724 RepID=A0A1I6FFB2_9PSEU|nr:LuxR family transcriptional regulator [Lentzea waywayandensis]SFR28620.1 regulatory protein, luxR family [Lentzea waywayandensis]